MARSERWRAANIRAQRTLQRCQFLCEKIPAVQEKSSCARFSLYKKNRGRFPDQSVFRSQKLWRSPCIRFIISFYRHSRFLINTSQVRNLRLVASGLRPGLYLLCLRAAYACADLASAAAGLASAAFLAGFFFFL